jgi:hypothetical protein
VAAEPSAAASSSVAAAFCTWSIGVAAGARALGCSVSRSFLAASGSDSIRLLAWSLSEYVVHASPPTMATITTAAPSARGMPMRTSRSTSGDNA